VVGQIAAGGRVVAVSLRSGADARYPLAVRRSSSLVVAAALCCTVLAVPCAAAAAAPRAAGRPTARLDVSRRELPAAGGLVVVFLRVTGATTCVLSSRPAVRGFGERLRCTHGVIARPLRIGANRLARRRLFVVRALVSNRNGRAVATLRIAELAVRRVPGGSGSRSSCPPGFVPAGPGACKQS